MKHKYKKTSLSPEGWSEYQGHNCSSAFRVCLCVCGIAGVLVSSRVCGIVGVVVSSASNCAFVFVMVYVRICCIVGVVMSSASNLGDNSN